MDLSVAVVVQISLGLMCVTCNIFPDALKTSIFTPKGQTMTLHKTIFFFYRSIVQFTIVKKYAGQTMFNTFGL